MAKLRLTVAAGEYDIVRPLKEGLVEAAGLELIFLTDMGPRERHWRLARKTEFDGLRGERRRLFHRARPGPSDHGDPGIPASPLPPRLRVHQYCGRHHVAERPDRE